MNMFVMKNGYSDWCVFFHLTAWLKNSYWYGCQGGTYYRFGGILVKFGKRKYRDFNMRAEVKRHDQLKYH